VRDLTVVQVPYTGNPACGTGCAVEMGFHEEWNTYKDGVLADVAQLAAMFPTYTIVAAGHSLGAAVATLAALDIVTLQNTSWRTTVYNFGSPRVGNPTFAKMVARILPAGKLFRVTHEQDIVPHLPPSGFKERRGVAAALRQLNATGKQQGASAAASRRRLQRQQRRRSKAAPVAGGLFDYIHAWHELWYNNDGNTSYTHCHDTPTTEDPDCSDSLVIPSIDDHVMYLGQCIGQCSMNPPDSDCPL
jgi:hypothetical protein